MDRKLYCELFVKFEKELDLNNYTFNSINIWPIVRFLSYNSNFLMNKKIN